MIAPVEGPQSIAIKKPRHAWLGVLLSIIVPGLGQAYGGASKRGLVAFLLYFLIVGGLLVYFVQPSQEASHLTLALMMMLILVAKMAVLIDAFRSVQRYNRHQELAPDPSRPKRMLLIVGCLIFMFFPSFTFESLIVKLLKYYVMQPFIIPTGAMAPAVMGHHFSIECSGCGNRYAYDFTPEYYNLAEEEVPVEPLPLQPPRDLPWFESPLCPLCGTRADADQKRYILHGDHLLVSKWGYIPQRWDLLVFRNPEDPSKNFIMRLVGMPGDRLQIVNGDVYCDGKIQRKPVELQETLWIKMFDLAYHSNTPSDDRAGHWLRPLVAKKNPSGWRVDFDQGEVSFDPVTDSEMDWLDVNPARLAFSCRTFLAYNGPLVERLPWVSDLKLSGSLKNGTTNGCLMIKMGKYGRIYEANIGFDGNYELIRAETDQRVVLASGTFDRPASQNDWEFSFAIADHMLTLSVNGQNLIWKGPDDPAAWGYQNNAAHGPPTLQLAGEGGCFELHQIRLYRDLHYTNQNSYGTPAERASEETGPFTLGPGEYFVLGDNSTASYDSRFWQQDGFNQDGESVCRPGIVAEEHLIGRAFKIYHPYDRAGTVY